MGSIDSNSAQRSQTAEELRTLFSTLLFTIVILLCTSAPLFAVQAATKSGTVIVLTNDQSRILVAADSREDNPSDDKACKILRLGNNAFYAATGLVYPDQSELVAESYKAVPSHNVLFVGKQWAETMTRRYEEDAKRDPTGFARDNVKTKRFITGIFGTNADNHLQHYEVYVWLNVKPNPNEVGKFIRSFSTDIKGPFSPSPAERETLDAFGEAQDLIGEIRSPQTKRAREAAAEIIEGAKARASMDDKKEFILDSFMQFALKFTDRKDLVGGPIDILELPKTGDSFWISVKPNCKDTGRLKKP